MNLDCVADFPALVAISVTNPATTVMSAVVMEDRTGGPFKQIPFVPGAADGGVIVEVTDGSSTFHWKRIFEGSINPNWWGAKGDNTIDDTLAFSAAIAYAAEHDTAINVTKGEYIITSTLLIPSTMQSFNIYGDLSRIVTLKSVIYFEADRGTLFEFDGGDFSNTSIKRLNIIGKKTTTRYPNHMMTMNNCTINNLELMDLNMDNFGAQCIRFLTDVTANYVYLDKVKMTNCAAFIDADSTDKIGEMITMQNLELNYRAETSGYLSVPGIGNDPDVSVETCVNLGAFDHIKTSALIMQGGNTVKGRRVFEISRFRSAVIENIWTETEDIDPGCFFQIGKYPTSRNLDYGIVSIKDFTVNQGSGYLPVRVMGAVLVRIENIENFRYEHVTQLVDVRNSAAKVIIDGVSSQRSMWPDASLYPGIEVNNTYNSVGAYFTGLQPYRDEDGDGVENMEDVVDNGTGDGSITDYTNVSPNDNSPDAFVAPATNNLLFRTPCYHLGDTETLFEWNGNGPLSGKTSKYVRVSNDKKDVETAFLATTGNYAYTIDSVEGRVEKLAGITTNMPSLSLEFCNVPKAMLGNQIMIAIRYKVETSEVSGPTATGKIKLFDSRNSDLVITSLGDAAVLDEWTEAYCVVNNLQEAFTLFSSGEDLNNTPTLYISSIKVMLGKKIPLCPPNIGAETSVTFGGNEYPANSDWLVGDKLMFDYPIGDPQTYIGVVCTDPTGPTWTPFGATA